VLQHAVVHDSAPLVLIWELGGFPAILQKNAILAAALQLRGFRTHMIICDGAPLGCIRRGIEENDPLDNWHNRCQGCSSQCAQMAEAYGTPFSRVGDYISIEQRRAFQRLSAAISLEDILDYSHRHVAVGQLAWSSLNRYLKGYSFKVTELPSENARIYRQYFYAALVNTEAAARAMEQMNPTSVLMSHGVYVDYAPALSLAHLQGRHAMSWSSGFADFLHHFTVPQDSNRLVLLGLRESNWLKRAAAPLTPDENQRLDNFLHERYFKQGARDISILSAPESTSALRKKLGIDNDRPTVCLFAHVNWDACFDFSTMIFPTANDWVTESIQTMIAVPEVNWIIRVHPGEITEGTVLSTGDIIKQTFPRLPEHIKVLWADSDINSYGLYQFIDVGITIFGTVGAELTAMGKPVIAAGEAHYSGKGFTLDAHSRSQYLDLLKSCRQVAGLTRAQVQLARQYAYSYFIERQIPIRVTQGHWGDLDPAKVSALLPGHDQVIDLVCARILDGEDVILGDSLLDRIYPVKQPVSDPISPGQDEVVDLLCVRIQGGDDIIAPESILSRLPKSVQKTLPAFPQNPTANLLEGYRLFESNDWHGALAKFDHVLQLQSHRQGVHLMRARCQAEIGQSALAAEAAEAELRIQPDHPDALEILIRLKESEGAPQRKMTELDIPVFSAKPLTAQHQAPRFKIRVPLLSQPSHSLLGPTGAQHQALQFSKPIGHSSQDANERISLSRPAGLASSHRALSKLMGFDSGGEVFTDGQRILRGIFPGKAGEARKALSAYERYDLGSRGLVRTAEVSDQWRQLGYDMVLEHEKISFITYAHEWPAEMLKEAALLQIDLGLELDRHGFVLKDSGASGNVLFRGPEPVFVDFLSILAKEDLEQQEWLKPRETSSPFQPLWSAKSGAFHEIYRRMFYPYLLYPLHMQHQTRHAEARQRLLATTLNTCFEVIKESEALAQAVPGQRRMHELASASRELALVRDDWQKFLRVLRHEVEGLEVGVESSNYSNYYELKREDFSFEPCSEWLPKQRGVYEVLKRLKPSTVLDIGANTGWFSILAAKQNCQVVAMDNDEASMNVLFRRAKQEALPILPLVMDFCKPSGDVAPFSGYEKDQHSRNSRIPGEVPLLLAMEKRLKCDLVLALAIVHHLTLGKGLSLEPVVSQLAGLAEKHLVMEFVPKEDPLILREPQFFQAYCSNPGSFSWYTEQNWLKALGRYFSRIEQKESTQGRTLLICSR